MRVTLYIAAIVFLGAWLGQSSGLLSCVVSLLVIVGVALQLSSKPPDAAERL